MGVEVDLIIESDKNNYAIEIKSSIKVQEKMFKGLRKFEHISGKKWKKTVLYQGEFKQNFGEHGIAMSYLEFFNETIFTI